MSFLNKSKWASLAPRAPRHATSTQAAYASTTPNVRLAHPAPGRIIPRLSLYRRPFISAILDPGLLSSGALCSSSGTARFTALVMSLSSELPSES